MRVLCAEGGGGVTATQKWRVIGTRYYQVLWLLLNIVHSLDLWPELGDFCIKSIAAYPRGEKKAYLIKKKLQSIYQACRMRSMRIKQSKDLKARNVAKKKVTTMRKLLTYTCLHLRKHLTWTSISRSKLLKLGIQKDWTLITCISFYRTKTANCLRYGFINSVNITLWRSKWSFVSDWMSEIENGCKTRQNVQSNPFSLHSTPFCS